MNLSNLFENAIDDLEMRRIEDLEAKMDDLARRAKETQDPKAIAALRHEFARCKAERDSYHYVREWEDTAPGHDASQTELRPVEETWDYATPWGKQAAIKQKATISRPASTSNDEVKTFAAQGYTIKFKPDVVEIYHGADLVYSRPGDFANPTRAQLGAIRGRVTDLANRKKKEIKEAGSPAQQAAIAINMKKHHQKPKTDESEERLRVSPHDQGAHAAIKGKPYASNPHPEGSKERLEWSKGHNSMRARKLQDSSEEFDFEPSPVASAIVRRIMFNHPELLQDYGPNLVNAAVSEVADYVGDVDEIGSSDVSSWVRQVERMLKENPPEAFDEGFQDFNKKEPYEVCLAGRPVKTFDYYEDARRFHDNWKKKLYNQGEQAKADKITLNPIMKEASMSWAAGKPTGPKFGGYLKGTDPAPTEFSNKGVGSCEESENPMGEKELAYLIAKARQKHDAPDPALHKGDEHEINGDQNRVGEGAKVDRMQQHIAKSEKALGHSKKDAESIAWATLNKRGYLDNANKKKHNESVNFMEWAVAQGNRFTNFTSNPAVYAQAKEAFLAEGFGTSLANVSSKISGHPRKMKSAQQIRNRAMKFAPQPVAEEHNDSEYDEEGGMAKNQIHTIKRNAEELEHLLSVDENLPEWIQLKLTLAQDYIQTAADYMLSAHERDHEIEVGQDPINEIKKGQKDSNGYTKCWPGKHAEGTKIGKNGGRVRNCVPNESLEETEAWQKANKRDKTDGMSKKAVKSYRREHPGSKLQTAVTTKPSKLKKGSKASKRRSSYCSRSKGQMKMHNISCAKTPDKAICKARRRWHCEGVENLDAMLAEAIEKNKELQPGQYYIWTVYFDDGGSQRIKVTRDDFDPKAYYARLNRVVINTDYDWEVHDG